METATTYVQNLISAYRVPDFSGYRVPDISKLWRQSDSAVDGEQQKPQVPILVRLEARLVQLQELALWIDPKSSVAALAIVHLVFWYLSNTSCTALNLGMWACILGFLYTTWVNKIWPEIRVEQPLEESSSWTPIRTEVFSAPELVQFSQAAKNKIFELFNFFKDMRTNTPGRFCLLACFTFSIIGYLGAFVTALGLLYYSLVGSLTIPGLVRILAQHHPCIQTQLESFWNPERVSNDVTDSPVLEDKSGVSIEQYPTLCNVYSKVQAQLASMVSSLNSSDEAKQDEEDELKEYLPEVDDEQSKKILEEGALSHEHIHSQEDDSLEYSSLMTGLGASMPDVEEEEVDSRHRPLPMLTVQHSTAESALPEEIEDEFLPRVDPSCNQLLLEELDDEEANSSLYFSGASGSRPVERKVSQPFPGFDESEDFEKEDFEFISEDELAEALQK